MMQVFRQAQASGGVKINWGAEHRQGKCPDCGGILDTPTDEDKKEWRKTKLLKRLCPNCGERKLGKLVVRTCSLEAPTLTCMSLKCLFGYIRKVYLYILVMRYNRWRIQYSVKHRENTIPEYYRTGEPLPDSFRTAIWEIVKLAIRR